MTSDYAISHLFESSGFNDALKSEITAVSGHHAILELADGQMKGQSYGWRVENEYQGGYGDHLCIAKGVLHGFPIMLH